MPERINVYKWKNLNLREGDIDTNFNHIVISFRPPSFDYQLYYSKNVDKFIFISSTIDKKLFKKMIDFRLTEDISRPLSTNLKYDAPDILKESIKNIKIDDYDEIIEKEFNPQIVVNNESFFLEENNNENRNKIYRHEILKEGEKVIFIRGDNSKGMFLPLNKNIFFKTNLKGRYFDNIKVQKSNFDELVNKEIIIDRNGVYTSFKYVFTKFMIENGSKFETNAGSYHWKNFADLLIDSYSWITLLKKALNKITEKERWDYKKSEKFLSEELASLDLSAKRIGYHVKWWSDFEIIDTFEGVYYIYEIEHPQRISDLKTIYGYLKKSFPSLNIKNGDAEKAYIASRTIQRIRNNFFKNKNDDVEYYNQIYKLLRDEVKYIFNNSPTFKIKTVDEVLIKKDVNSLEILSDSDCLGFIKS